MDAIFYRHPLPLNHCIHSTYPQSTLRGRGYQTKLPRSQKNANRHLPPHQDQRTPLQISIPRPIRLLLLSLPPAPPPQNLVENAPILLENQLNPTSGATETLQFVPESAPLELDLPPLEDVESIQVSISLLIAALARNRIDSKRAAVLLYGLQLASTNARSITIEPSATSVIRTLSRTKSGLDLAVKDEA
jgi:hypothetical protein